MKVSFFSKNNTLGLADSRQAFFHLLNSHQIMKIYKVEALNYYSKITRDKDHIIKSSGEEIQNLLNEYSKDGWTLASTDATTFGSAMYVYLYFEKEVAE